MTDIVFIDTETLGLDPDRHAIWEIGAIRYDPEAHRAVDSLEIQVRLTAEQMAAGDPFGMEIGGFHDRYDIPGAEIGDPREVCQALLGFIPDGAHLAGAVVSFDEERLRRLMARHEFPHPWHYHLIDVEAEAIGYLSRCARIPGVPEQYGYTSESLRTLCAPPWKSDDLTAALGLTPVPESERHTALGDARWAMRIYEAIHSLGMDAPGEAEVLAGHLARAITLLRQAENVIDESEAESTLIGAFLDSMKP